MRSYCPILLLLCVCPVMILSQENDRQTISEHFIKRQILNSPIIDPDIDYSHKVTIEQQGFHNTALIEQLSNNGHNNLNILLTLQHGKKNHSRIESYGANHNISIRQIGNMNTFNQHVCTSDFNTSVIRQLGNENSGNLKIDGSFNEVRIEIQGNNNTVGSAQGIAVNGNQARISIQQLGDFNKVDSHQEGSHQQTFIRQIGDFNTISLSQKSNQKDISSNIAYLEQIGFTNAMDVQQGGNNSSIFILQNGMGNDIEVDIQHDEIIGSIYQIGNRNIFSQQITGQGQQYEIIQEGNNNLLVQNDNRETPLIYQIHQKGSGMKLILDNQQIITK